MKTQTKNLSRLLRIVKRLRAPDGCPWDRKQTHRSLRQHLIEESYEALDALESGISDDFRDELGDILLQIALHAEIASERRRFNFDDVAKSIAEKLIRRHPHIFGGKTLRSSKAVLRQWEAIKKAENHSDSILNELPRALPALLKADKVQRKVARVGFDWQHTGDVVAKIEEELRELKRALVAGNRREFQEELGDLLFATVNLARFENLHAEELLNRTISKFIARFQELERDAHAQGKRLEECSAAELDALWETAKRRLKTRKRCGTRAARARSS
ncbi:MAG: nucleoside triphosphate pyrophosphohydrolase [Verrucomicrobia bacterium]|nr:nucleoside triphosphate pyrophosphohydrolase [Verrucomicrobiota bacterium]